MGTYNKGILGPFSGKVGTVVGASWRGKDVLRSLPRASDREATESQLLQRLKFSTVSSFLTPIGPVISRYYGSNNGDRTRKNQAMSYHLKEALVYVNPNYEILYNKVQISKGDLLGVQNPVVAAAGFNAISYTWEDNSGQGSAKPTDQLVVVVYEPISGQFYYVLNADTRIAGSTSVTLPLFFLGLEVQSWITFAAADEKSYATSVYMGAIVIT